MRKHEVKALLGGKLDEVFAVLQQQEGITEGDVDPAEAMALDEITERAADLILAIIKQQKGA